MTTSLTLDTVRSTDGRLVLTATGEIDLSNVEPFSQALTVAAADADSSGDATLVIDLSGVEYLDSAAVSVLFPYAERIRVVAHPHLVRIFDISGFSELATVEPPATQAQD